MAKSNNNENEGNFKLCVLSMQTKGERIKEAGEKAKKAMKEKMLFTVTHAAEYEYLVLGNEAEYVSIPAYDGTQRDPKGYGEEK